MAPGREFAPGELAALISRLTCARALLYDETSMYTCRECEQPINQATEVCPYCDADLTAPPLEELVMPPKKKNIGKRVGMWAVLIAGLWGIVLFVLPPRPETARPAAEKTALAALSDLRAALTSYSNATGGYPAALEILGSTARTTAQWAQSAGYDIQYVPAAPDTDGRFKTFALTARAGNYGYRSFYTDESGSIRATRDNRVATSQDPEIK
jgi:RNA polymerase subunit RPABC4/transcription elongation factor Spt4